MLASVLLCLPAAAGGEVPQRCGDEISLLHQRLNLDRLESRVGETYLRRPPPQAGLYLIHIWAVECEPCVNELPRILAMARHYASTPHLHFLLVSESIDEKKERDLLRRLKAEGLPSENLPTLTHVRDPEGGLRRILQSGTQPFTLIVDGQRVLRQAFIGSLLRRRAELTQSLDLLLRVLSERPMPSAGEPRGRSAKSPMRQGS